MDRGDIITSINTAQQAIIDSGHTLPMTDARIIACQKALEAIKEGAKLREVPQCSVVYLLRDRAMVQLMYDPDNRVYWASAYEEVEQ